ncbi:MAG: GNAT family N-acetyltransferase [Chloroflexota bacterium]
MKIAIKDINEHTFKELLAPCQSCLYWEAPEKSGKDEGDKPMVSESEAIEIKQGWFEKTGRKFGTCGKILYVDGKAAGFVQYAPPKFFNKITEYSRELFPPDPEGILISCLYINQAYQGKGLGTKLLKAVIEDLREKGYQALETYSRDDSTSNASGPTILYLENGFKLVKPKKWGNGTYSLMRLELNS